MDSITIDMVKQLIALAEKAKADQDNQSIREYVNNLEPKQQAEFLALMWLGRNDAADGPISFAEHLQHAKENLDDAGSYMAGKMLPLPGYLRNGVRLMRERGELD